MSKDTFSFKGWTTSDSFIKRAISIACYGAVGTLFLYILLAIIFMLFLFMGLGVGWAFHALPKAKADLPKATADLPKATGIWQTHSIRFTAIAGETSFLVFAHFK